MIRLLAFVWGLGRGRGPVPLPASTLKPGLDFCVCAASTFIVGGGFGPLEEAGKEGLEQSHGEYWIKAPLLTISPLHMLGLMFLLKEMKENGCPL